MLTFADEGGGVGEPRFNANIIYDSSLEVMFKRFISYPHYLLHNAKYYSPKITKSYLSILFNRLFLHDRIDYSFGYILLLMLYTLNCQ